MGQGFFGENAGDYFGWSLALSTDGNTLAISAALSNGEAGHVSIYGLDGDTQSWKELGQDIIGSRGEHLGEYVSLSTDGKTLAIGAKLNDDKGDNAGRAVVYRWDETVLNYEQLGSHIYGEAAGDQFGLSVALSSNGTTLAVGGGAYVTVYSFDNSTLL